MSLISDTGILRVVDMMAVVFAQSYQLARVRVLENVPRALRLMARRDHLHWELELLRCELAVLRALREGVNAHARSGLALEFLGKALH